MSPITIPQMNGGGRAEGWTRSPRGRLPPADLPPATPERPRVRGGLLPLGPDPVPRQRRWHAALRRRPRHPGPPGGRRVIGRSGGAGPPRGPGRPLGFGPRMRRISGDSGPPARRPSPPPLIPVSHHNLTVWVVTRAPRTRTPRTPRAAFRRAPSSARTGRGNPRTGLSRGFPRH